MYGVSVVWMLWFFHSQNNFEKLREQDMAKLTLFPMFLLVLVWSEKFMHWKRVSSPSCSYSYYWSPLSCVGDVFKIPGCVFMVWFSVLKYVQSVLWSCHFIQNCSFSVEAQQVQVFTKCQVLTAVKGKCSIFLLSRLLLLRCFCSSHHSLLSLSDSLGLWVQKEEP